MSLRRSTRIATSTAASHVYGAHSSTKSVSTSGTTSIATKRARPEPSEEEQLEPAHVIPPKRKRQQQDQATEVEPKEKRRRGKKADIVFKPEDFPARVPSRWKVGPHVSAAGGVENTVINAASIGATAFALFVKSQRKWSSKDLTPESIASFKSRLNEFGYSPQDVLPHGSYLVNLGNPDKEKRSKSYECFLDDLKRCEQLGLGLYNFHPGSTVGQATSEESCELIAKCINDAHGATEHIVVVLENMAGAGNIIGSTFEQLKHIIDHVEDKARVGVCLDTCHLFAAGYDIRSQEGWKTMEDFDRVVGLSYLRGMHLNDSKGGLGSKKDRHENIGLGELSITTFAHILTDPRTQGIPLILETPAFDGPGSGLTEGMEVWKKEVEVLHGIAASADEEKTEKHKDGMDARLRAWTAEVKSVVKDMKAKKDAKEAKRKNNAAASRKRKKSKSEDHDDDDSTDEGSEDD